MTSKKRSQGKASEIRETTIPRKEAIISEIVTRKPLQKAKPENAFYCVDGRLFYDLKDLADGLMNMSGETFYYHVHDGNNDFSNWIRDVLQDKELAENIASTIDIDETATYVIAQLGYYEDKGGINTEL